VKVEKVFDDILQFGHDDASGHWSANIVAVTSNAYDLPQTI
jgi:hypothetical protein